MMMPFGSKSDALERFLENHGEDFISCQGGYTVIETYYDKKFRALGGDTNRLISFFEDYHNMTDAARHYIAAIIREECGTISAQVERGEPSISPETAPGSPAGS